MIIHNDTVWYAGQTYNLREDIQIATNATLKIEAGAIVNGFGHNVQAFGSFIVDGAENSKTQLNNLNVRFGSSNYQYLGSISINNADVRGGTVLHPNGDSSSGNLSITNSVLRDVHGFYIWYPLGGANISGNLFVGGSGLSIGTSYDVSVDHNVFYNVEEVINGQANVVTWASYGPQVKVNYNSFIGANPSIQVVYGGKTDGQNNWFGSVNKTMIDSKIIDRSDNLSLSDFIEHDQVLSPSDPRSFSGVVLGSFAVDTLISQGNDYVYGDNGNDVLLATSNHTTLNGGNGNDTAVFADVSWSYNIEYNGATSAGLVSDKNGSLDAKLASIETLEFVNGALTTASDSVAGQIYALYDGLLGRAPDLLGLEHWVATLKSGASVKDIASAFLASAEGQARAGAADNATFVEQLYQANLDRGSDPGGKAAWVGALDNGTSRTDVALGFALSQEHIANLKSVFDAGIFVPDQTASSVARLYHSVLDRAPDPGGLKGWTGAVKAGADLHTIADTFLKSAEYEVATTGFTDAQFVEQMYGQILGRSGEAGGIAAWNVYLDHGGARGTVIDGFTDSLEFQGKYAGQGSAAYVEELYEHILGRQSDGAGLKAWSGALDSHALSRTDVAHAFTGSDEFQAKYVGPSAASFVDDLYENALGRDPDAGGLKVWTDALAHGMSRADVVVAISQSTEAQQHLVSEIQQGWHLA